MNAPTVRIMNGDAITHLRELESGSVHCVVTSPPYWGLRDYKVDGQLGLEKTPEEYVQRLVEIFREVRRVLRDDGTVWLNLGDSYNGSGGAGGDYNVGGLREGQPRYNGRNYGGLKPKDLVGIPWRVAFALQEDGWYLRSDIIWNKPNPMPESVRDRPTRAHEYIFLLTKSQHYFFDQEAVREANDTKYTESWGNFKRVKDYKKGGGSGGSMDKETFDKYRTSGRNIRSVWTMTTKPYSEAHFATFPPELPERCIKAGTSLKGCCPECGAPWVRCFTRFDNRHWTERGKPHEKGQSLVSKGSRNDGYGNFEGARDITTGWQPTCSCGKEKAIPCTVLDIFAGSGTTGEVARSLGRSSILIELNPEYIDMIRKRTNADMKALESFAAA